MFPDVKQMDGEWGCSVHTLLSKWASPNTLPYAGKCYLIPCCSSKNWSRIRGYLSYLGCRSSITSKPWLAVGDCYWSLTVVVGQDQEGLLLTQTHTIYTYPDFSSHFHSFPPSFSSILPPFFCLWFGEMGESFVSRLPSVNTQASLKCWQVQEFLSKNTLCFTGKLKSRCLILFRLENKHKVLTSLKKYQQNHFLFFFFLYHYFSGNFYLFSENCWVCKRFYLC